MHVHVLLKYITRIDPTMCQLTLRRLPYFLPDDPFSCLAPLPLPPVPNFPEKPLGEHASLAPLAGDLDLQPPPPSDRCRAPNGLFFIFICVALLD